MSYQLKTDEICEALNDAGVPNACDLIARYEALATEMAQALAVHIGVSCGVASFEGLAFAGTCAPFHPAFAGQPLPDVFASNEFDNATEWEA